MELSYEMPTKYLDVLGAHTDYCFTLAHLALTDPVYLKYYRSQSKYKICDTGVFELGRAVPYGDILKAAQLLGANEVVAPDALRNAQETIDTTAEFINFMKNSGDYKKYKVMGVVQGESLPRWVSCLTFMANSPDIDVIGVSYIGCEVFSTDLTAARIKAVRCIIDMVKCRKPIHLLGIGGNPLEVKLHEYSPQLRSCDTSIPVVHGLANDRFDLEKGLTTSKMKRPDNFFDTTVDPQQMDAIINNMKMMKAWASSVQKDFVHVPIK